MVLQVVRVVVVDVIVSIAVDLGATAFTTTGIGNVAVVTVVLILMRYMLC